jgi:hypothetical protein
VFKNVFLLSFSNLIVIWHGPNPNTTLAPLPSYLPKMMWRWPII